MGEKLKRERPNVKLIINGVERREWRSHLDQQQKVRGPVNMILFITIYTYYIFSCLKEINFRLRHSFMKDAHQIRSSLLAVVLTSPP